MRAAPNIGEQVLLVYVVCPCGRWYGMPEGGSFPVCGACAWPALPPRLLGVDGGAFVATFVPEVVGAEFLSKVGAAEQPLAVDSAVLREVARVRGWDATLRRWTTEPVE